jgi:hypothetical protein
VIEVLLSCGAVPGTAPSSRVATGKTGGVTEAVLLPNPYAHSLGTFVEFPTAVWWGAGGVLSSVWNTVTCGADRRPRRPDELPRT